MTTRIKLLWIGMAMLTSLAWLATRPPRTPDTVGPGDRERRVSPISESAQVVVAPTESSSPARHQITSPEPETRVGLHVHVVSHAGQAAPAVRVELRCRVGGWKGAPCLGRATTDADGRASLTPTIRMLERVRAAGTPEFFLATTLPGVPDVHRSLGTSCDPAQAPANHPIDLRLPPLGTLVVPVVEGSGAPVGDDVTVTLYFATSTAHCVANVQAGVARFPAVPLHQQIRLTAHCPDTHDDSEAVVFAGPRSDGEEVTCTIQLGRPLPWLVGRCVDATGAPLPHGHVAIGVGLRNANQPIDPVADRRRTQLSSYQLDARGHFRLPLRTRELDGRQRFLLAAQHHEGSEVETCGSVDLPATLTPGEEFDVGELHLHANGVERLLVSGRVVDELGRPIAGANVGAAYWHRPAGRWRSLNDQTVLTERDGTFTVRAAKPGPATFTLRAAKYGRVPVRREVTEGARGLELVLARGGLLTAQIVAEGVSPLRLSGSIEDSSGHDQEPNETVGPLGTDTLAPGRYAIVVHIALSSWQLLRIDGIDVPAGGRATDPRLANIDVSHLCRTLRLRLIDANQTLLANERCEVRDAEGRGLTATSEHNGRLEVAVPRAIGRFDVMLPDGRRGVALNQDAEQVVVIR